MKLLPPTSEQVILDLRQKNQLQYCTIQGLLSEVDDLKKHIAHLEDILSFIITENPKVLKPLGSSTSK